jgi:TPR repeat protein
MDKAKVLLERAAELGHGASYFTMAVKHYYELAAMSDCVISRLKLGAIKTRAGKFDQAVKQFSIAASQDVEEALNIV